ncbi:hypothetical protein BT67DRAFT_401855 [Trichocladium antarcticum]|uniref:Uncharacterized protein n=1 Tax=Trichocladium antarcticum TaxID=1450529 RepID=A0AAN6ULS1_9PEZI|nr:hypothetical protein BT67DRAFT_401855 [Trichocladium antarcticum]
MSRTISAVNPIHPTGNAGHSSVGNSALYQSQNQRNFKQSEVEELRRRTGENVQGYLPKDQLDAVNRLYEEKVQRRQSMNMKTDPTFAAMHNGNKPSKGAIIDKELQEEDEARVRKMDLRNEILEERKL